MSGSRSATSTMEVKEEEAETPASTVNRRNSVVELSCFNRPDQEPFIEAMKKPKPGYEHELGATRVMAFKCLMAFEWPQNQAWNAEERLRQRINLENQKDPDIWGTALGKAALALSRELKKMSDAGTWNKLRKRLTPAQLIRTREASPTRR